MAPLSQKLEPPKIPARFNCILLACCRLARVPNVANMLGISPATVKTHLKPNFEGWTFDSVGKRCKCWVSALAVDFVVLNDLDVRRALS
jgi:hypothetical protein